MKRLIFVCSLTAAGCLNTGCVVQPMKATDLFGVSNPVSSIDIPGYGKVKLATDVTTHINVQKNEAGFFAVDVTFDSKASTVVDSEGKRIPNMEAQRIADEQRTIQQEQIRSAERVELYRMVSQALPMLAQLAQPRPPTTEQPARVGPLNLSPELWDIVNNAMDVRIRDRIPTITSDTVFHDSITSTIDMRLMALGLLPTPPPVVPPQ